MGHLEKDGTGHLTKKADGHLARCIGGVDCNSCNPALLDTYTVTIAGLARSFAKFNGVWTVTYAATCLWSIFPDPPNDSTIVLFYSGAGPWKVEIELNEPGLAGLYRWTKPAPNNDCAPVDTYEYNACDDTQCDPLSCDDSVGATCVVS